MSEPVEILRSVLLVVYIGTLIAVAVYGFHRYVLVFLYLKHRNHGYFRHHNHGHFRHRCLGSR